MKCAKFFIENLTWKIFDLKISARVDKATKVRNYMERISQRKHYDFVSIENFIRCKGYPESVSDSGEKSNIRRGTCPQICFFVKLWSP